jgi:hypothetical protein
MRITILAACCCMALAACDSTQSVAQHKTKKTLIKPTFTLGPAAQVYKTRKDYANNVPVILSDDKTKIVSYPDPKDFSNQDHYPVPVALHKGYLLDQRGIGAHVAYLKLTYKEYAALAKAPSMQEMMGMIIDKNPLTELCNCGNKQTFSDIETQLNDLIDAGKLKTACKVLK